MMAFHIDSISITYDMIQKISKFSVTIELRLKVKFLRDWDYSKFFMYN